MFRIIPTGCFSFSFWERAGGFRACEGSFFVENKCMARGSLKRKNYKKKNKKKIFSFSYICHGSAHSPNPMAMKITVYRSTTRKKQNDKKKKSKERQNGRVCIIPLIVAVLPLCSRIFSTPCVFFFCLFVCLIVFSHALLLSWSFILKQETLNCQKLHSSLRRHRAQPRSNSANRSSFPQPAGERGLSLLSHRFSSSASSSSSPPPPLHLLLLLSPPPPLLHLLSSVSSS